MKSLLLTLLAVSLAVPALAQDAGNSSALDNAPKSQFRNYGDDMAGRFGIGLMVGEPTGLTAKYFIDSVFAIDAGLGWSFHDETDPQLHADLLWHKFDLIPVEKGQMPVYLGVGGRGKFRDNADDRAGIRFPIGISYIFDDKPLDVFVEFAPIIDFTPSTRGSFNIAIGARWWF